MITDFFLDILYAFVSSIAFVIQAFGDVSPNNELTVAISNLSSYLSSVSAYLPVTTILAIVVFELAFEGIYFTYKLIKWSYQKVPGIN